MRKHKKSQQTGRKFPKFEHYSLKEFDNWLKFNTEIAQKHHTILMQIRHRIAGKELRRKRMTSLTVTTIFGATAIAEAVFGSMGFLGYTTLVITGLFGLKLFVAQKKLKKHLAKTPS